jgi:hypothetical protein
MQSLTENSESLAEFERKARLRGQSIGPSRTNIATEVGTELNNDAPFHLFRWCKGAKCGILSQSRSSQY